MASTARLLPLCLVLGFACGALFLGGCGDDGPADEPADTPDWSEPAGKSATGSPDGDAGGTRTAQALLSELLAKVRAGRGQADPEFDRHVESVAAVLWAPDAEGPERTAAQVHMQLAVIAGDAGRFLAMDPPQSVDATEKKIHAAWTAAAAGTPDDYRAWCADAGAALLKEREQALRDRFFK